MFNVDSHYRLILEWGRAEHGDGLKRILYLAEAVCKGSGLDVGSSFFEKQSAPFPGAIPVDITIPGSGTATDLSQYAPGSLDYVFCSHTLEHVSEPELACREAWRVLKPGGRYFLYLPFPGHPMWDPEICEACRDEHKWQPDPQGVGRLLLVTGFSVCYLEHEKDDLWSFVAIGVKLC